MIDHRSFDPMRTDNYPLFSKNWSYNVENGVNLFIGTNGLGKTTSSIIYGLVGCNDYTSIEMVSPEAADNTVAALHGVEMADRALTVRITEDKPAAPATNYRRSFTAPPKTYNNTTRPQISDRPKRPRRPLN